MSSSGHPPSPQQDEGLADVADNDAGCGDRSGSADIVGRNNSVHTRAVGDARPRHAGKEGLRPLSKVRAAQEGGSPAIGCEGGREEHLICSGL